MMPSCSRPSAFKVVARKWGLRRRGRVRFPGLAEDFSSAVLRPWIFVLVFLKGAWDHAPKFQSRRAYMKHGFYFCMLLIINGAIAIVRVCTRHCQYIKDSSNLVFADHVGLERAKGENACGARPKKDDRKNAALFRSRSRTNKSAKKIPGLN